MGVVVPTSKGAVVELPFNAEGQKASLRIANMAEFEAEAAKPDGSVVEIGFSTRYVIALFEFEERGAEATFVLPWKRASP